MSDEAEFTVKHFQTVAQGIIKEVRVVNGEVITDLAAPAPDRYSSPSFFEIKSKNKLGVAGQEIEGVLCQINGFKYRRQYVDKNTGEQKYFTQKVTQLIAID